jgi:hypothetical protein
MAGHFKFVLYTGFPMSQADVQAVAMVKSVGFLAARVGIHAVTAETRTTVPRAVLAGTPILINMESGVSTTPGDNTLRTLHGMVQDALGREAQQSQMREHVLRQSGSVAPLDPRMRARMGPGGDPYATNMSDREPRWSETQASQFRDPRSMPGSSLPHPSQLGAAYGRGQPSVSATGHGAFVSGTASTTWDNTWSQLGGQKTVGGGMGQPGSTTSKFGRAGIGFGTDFNVANNPHARIHSDPNQQPWSRPLAATTAHPTT